jgi:hypothetical protein
MAASLTAAFPKLRPAGFAAPLPASVSPRCYHTGGTGPIAGTCGTTLSAGDNTTPSATETYMCELIVLHTCLVKGISFKNGNTVGTDKAAAALLDSQGNVLATSAVAGATTSGANSYQALDFAVPAGPIQLTPGVYYVALQFNGTATGTTFGTFTGLTPPITFTASLGPMASLY